MSEPPRVLPLSDAALARLRVVLDEPDLSATRYELGNALGGGGGRGPPAG